MRNHFTPMIITLSLITNSCDNDAIVNPYDNEFVLLEIKRHTAGTALSDTTGDVHIDFGGYHYEDSTGNLYVYRILDLNFQKDSPYRVLCAMERSLGGDLGGGMAGGVIPIDEVPTVVQIMTYPLPGQDSLTINNIDIDGSVELLFKNKKMKIESKTESIAEENRQDMTTVFGRFNVHDRITIINHGLLKKEKIIWP